MLYYWNSLHKLQARATTTKRPSRWSNLDFLESLGSKEWENHIARVGFWLFVKQCHPSVQRVNWQLVRQIVIPLSTKILCSVQNDQKPARLCTKVFDHFVHCKGFFYFRGTRWASITVQDEKFYKKKKSTG